MKRLVYDLQEAQDQIFEKCSCMDTEQIALEKAAGRVLAKDVLAEHHVPLFDKSPLDGYAFCAADTQIVSETGQVKLSVTSEVAAGDFFSKTLKAGCAIKILTGAPIPDGADAVAMYEDTLEEEGYVTLYHTYQSGQNIVRCGEDVTQGSLIALCGTKIDAAVHGMLASQGIQTLEVYKEPLVGIISQGNELLNPGELLCAGKIYNSNRYMLGTALKKENFSSIYLGSVRDDAEKISELLERAADMYDVVIMTGGVSVGTYDYTEAALEKAGAEILVDKIQMKPGSSCCAAMLHGVPVFGLSGNPAAAMTTFHLVVMPALRKISGLRVYMQEKIEVQLMEDFPKKSPVMRILKGKLELSGRTVQIRLNEQQANGSVSAMNGADVFAVVPAGSGPLKAGSWLDAYII